MRLHMSDSIWAGLIAFVVWGTGAIVCFAIPHGFEEQIGWFKLLMPGILIGGPLFEHMSRSNPNVASLGYWTSSVLISFMCYFGLSLLSVKLYRRVKTP